MISSNRHPPSESAGYSLNPPGLKVSQLPTAPFGTSHLTAPALTDLDGNVPRLPESTAANFEAIYAASLHSFASSAGQHTLPCRLMTMGINGMTHERAAETSRQLCFRAREMMDRNQRLKLGVTKANAGQGNARRMADPAAPPPADLKRDSGHRAASRRLYTAS